MVGVERRSMLSKLSLPGKRMWTVERGSGGMRRREG